jgi:acetylornithine deacetylase/succinyl-diaminopimelate desuccinylase-like protein
MRTTEQLIERHLDAGFVARTLRELARVPTAVPLGYDTLVDADALHLLHYARDEVRSRIAAVAADAECRDVGGSLLVRDGAPGSGEALLLQTYSVAQHHNLMAEPFSGSLARRDGRDVVLGQGVSQAKAHQAALLGVLKLLRDAGRRPARPVWWTVNNEGRSSHACTTALLEAMGERPALAVLLVDTGLAISLGNRGRIDVDVSLSGEPAHSSTPELARDPIAGVAEVVRRLRDLRWEDEHPRLGGRHAVVYKVRFEPLAPHTIPARAELTVDCRLLPGDDPAAVAAQVQACLGDLAPLEATVRPGVTMLPSLTDPDEPVVRRLQESIAAVRGGPAPTTYDRGTFDAAGTSAQGIPTVMWGAGGAGDWPLGEDFVALDDVLDEVRVIAHLLLREPHDHRPATGER